MTDHSAHHGHPSADPARKGSVERLPSRRTVTVESDHLACPVCRTRIEAELRHDPHVVGVETDSEQRTVRVELQLDGVTEAQIRELIDRACGGSSAVPVPKPAVSSHSHVHAAWSTSIEEPASAGHDGHGAAAGQAAMEQAAPDHAAHAHHGAHDLSDPRLAAAMEADMRRRFWISLVLGIPVVLYSPLATNVLGIRLPTPFDIPRDWVMLVFATPIALWTSSVFHIGAYHSLRSGVLNMSVLVSLGILTSYLFSVGLTLFVPGQETFYEAAVMLAVFLLFGHWMEMKARRSSSDSVRKLLDLTPQRATVERNGVQVDVPVAEVVVGDIVILKPGDRVPVDGEVIDGQSAIDESMITGESLPVEKAPGDEVIAGTINQSGSLRFRATKVGADTALAQIVRLVETAQSSKAPAQRIADRAAHYLVIVAVGAGLITFVVWLLAAQASLLVALTFAVTAVVIACPDALGLATPTAVMVATDLAAKRGILFKQAVSLEQASKIEAIIFDKTGTLTEGRPQVTDVIVTGSLAEDELLRLVAAAEARSGHPLAEAILVEAHRRKLQVGGTVEAFESLAGLGVRAVIDGRTVLAGTQRLLEAQGVPLDGLAGQTERLVADAKQVVLVAIDGEPAGVIAAADQIRPGAAKAIAELHALGIQTVMMTGDTQHTAEIVAREVGIERVFAEVLPEDKAEGVKRLQAEGRFVAMVGDGINDAPALAQADVGIAIGAGTDVAVETGDVVLMKSDPADVLAAIRISQATVRKMKQNLFWAAIYNLIAIPIAAGALFPTFGIMLRPEFGALAMSASSITVVTNALLLRREV